MPLLDFGPKFSPLIVIDWEPSVRIVVPDTSNEVIDGGAYDKVAVDNALAWDPTVTIHLCPVPDPNADVQEILKLAVITVQLVAVYKRPDEGPYVAII